MVTIPAAAAYRFVVSGHEIEGRSFAGVDVQFPWEQQPAVAHDHTMAVSGVAPDHNASLDLDPNVHDFVSLATLTRS